MRPEAEELPLEGDIVAVGGGGFRRFEFDVDGWGGGGGVRVPDYSGA